MRLLTFFIGAAVLLSTATAAPASQPNHQLPRLNVPTANDLPKQYNFYGLYEAQVSYIKNWWASAVDSKQRELLRKSPDGKIEEAAKRTAEDNLRERLRTKLKKQTIEVDDWAEMSRKHGQKYRGKRYKLWKGEPGDIGFEETEVLDTDVRIRKIISAHRSEVLELKDTICRAKETLETCESSIASLERRIKELEAILEGRNSRRAEDEGTAQEPEDAGSDRSQFSVHSPRFAPQQAKSLDWGKPSSLVLDGVGTLAGGGLAAGVIGGARRIWSGAGVLGRLGKVLEF